MTTLRTVRHELKDLIATGTGKHVVPRPLRQAVTAETFFFDARSGNRETQTGGEACEIPVWLVVPYDDAWFDVVDEYIDGDNSLIDLVDMNGTLPCGAGVSISGQWSEQAVEIAGVTHLGCQFTVTAKWD